MTDARLGPLQEVLPVGAVQSSEGHLGVGGCDLVEVAAEFGTPLIVLDRATFESRSAAFASALGTERVFYAGKSFLCVAVCELVESLGLSLDVCSGGELATAMQAGFPPSRILFHGNNKSGSELEGARDAGVGRVAVDSANEIDRLESLGGSCRLLVRVTPGVEATTHEYIQTGKQDSKFGFSLDEGMAMDAVRRVAGLRGYEFAGVHAHIGSQIVDVGGFRLAITRMAQFAADVRDDLGIEIEELNLGGGFGIAYAPGDDAVDPAAVAAAIVEDVKLHFTERKLEPPAVALEPGRSIVGPAGVTLYTVGTIKSVPGVRTFAAVDGGMSDNPRPALYGARYTALLANRVSAPGAAPVTIAGKHCESGDIIVRDAHLPADLAIDDLVCIPATGAYGYSMASTYNRVPRPPVVMVWDGHAAEIVGRETDSDLLRLDRHLDGSLLA